MFIRLKYLGVYLNKRLTFIKHINTLYKKPCSKIDMTEKIWYLLGPVSGTNPLQKPGPSTLRLLRCHIHDSNMERMSNLQLHKNVTSKHQKGPFPICQNNQLCWPFPILALFLRLPVHYRSLVLVGNWKMHCIHVCPMTSIIMLPNLSCVFCFTNGEEECLNRFFFFQNSKFSFIIGSNWTQGLESLLHRMFILFDWSER